MPISKFRSVDPLIIAWARNMRARGLAERTVMEQPATVDRIAHDIGVAPRDMTTVQLEAWFARKHLSPGSRATYRVALRAWFTYLDLADLRSDDPTRRLGKVKAPKYRPRPMRTSDLIRLLNSGIRTRTRAMILLAAYQGFRVSEVAAMRGQDLRSGTLHVIGKGGREDWLPVHPAIVAEAKRRPQIGWWFPSYALPGESVRGKSVSRVISDAMSRCGVPGTPHALRHWYGSSLRRAGVDLRVVQELMRHSSLATTALYMDVDDDEKRDALYLLPNVA